MKGPKTILIPLAFGAAVRDIIRTDLFRDIISNKNVHVIVLWPGDDGAFISEFSQYENVSVDSITKFRPNLLERIVMILQRAHLRSQSKTMDLGNTAGDTSSIDKVYPLLRIIERTLGRDRVKRLLSWASRLVHSDGDSETILRKYNPDLVLLTRLVNYSNDYPFLRAAERLKIQTVCLASSWDNLSSKVFPDASVDHILVWNEIMKQDAVRLYSYQKDSVITVGPPRFDYYFDVKREVKKSEARKILNISTKCKVITYCTGSSQTAIDQKTGMSDEPKFVRYLLRAISKGRYGDAHLVLRLHPQANTAHYEEFKGLADVTLQIPGAPSAFHDRLFTAGDEANYAYTLIASDVVLNVASTVTIDAAIFDVPVVCLGIDEDETDPRRSIHRYYEFDHYKSLSACEGFDLVLNYSDLDLAVLTALENPTHRREGRQKIVTQQCTFADGQSGARAAAAVKKLMRLE